MRLRDLTDFLRLRRLTENPWEVVRFRKGQAPGPLLRVRFRDGSSLLLRGGCADFHMFHRIFLQDEYRLAGVPAGRGCIVDLGANVGVFSARASALSARTICVEPQPDNFALLEKNLQDREGVIRERLAIAAAPGTVRLFAPRGPSMTGAYSSIPGPAALHSGSYEEVQATTLDDLFSRHAIDACDLLKVDIEGMEYEALHAASDETFRRIARIHGEYHDVRPDDPETRIDRFAEFLRGKGYEVEVEPHRRKPNHGMFFAWRPAAAS